MQTDSSDERKNRKKSVLFLQLLFVTLAFALMVLSSSLFVRNMLKNHLSNDADSLLTQTKLKIESELIEAQAILHIVSNTVSSMILGNESSDKVFEYLESMHQEMDKRMGRFIFDGFFGYFEVFGDVFFHSGGWEDENFEATDRPWYEAAVDADDKMVVTPIYYSPRTFQYDITYAQRIFGNEGEPLAMVCLNVRLDRIRDYVMNMQIAEGGYGVLLGEEIDVIAHHSPEFISKHAREISPGFSLISHELELGNDIFEREFDNYLNQWTVASTMRLDNGWVLTLMTPKAAYYHQMQQMIFIISVLGASFAVVLIVILIRLDLAKNMADEQSDAKSALLKEAQDASAAKSKFLATMSHEIRTPMNVILGVTESSLENEKLESLTREGYEKIYNSANLLLHIINDILDLSKIEAGKLELNPAKYAVLSLINDVAQLNLIRFQHKPIKLKLSVDKNIPLELIGDELRIKQILNNLLTNAFKYTDTGEITLSFAVENPAQNCNTETILVLCVSDTGQGMTPEQVERLFDEYTRFNLESNRTTMGTGLGMSITRNLLKMMNGVMSVISNPGKGTTVTARIPQKINGSDVLGKKAAEDLQNFIFKNAVEMKRKKIVRELMPYGRVLIVDDMVSNLDVAKLLMKPYQLQIETAGSGFEAFEIIKNGKEYDIVFMDHMMPEMDGLETTKRIRELGYRHPIIALTANAVVGQQEIFLTNGFDAFISKPIDMRQLNDSLNKFIRDKARSPQ